MSYFTIDPRSALAAASFGGQTLPAESAAGWGGVSRYYPWNGYAAPQGLLPFQAGQPSASPGLGGTFIGGLLPMQAAPEVEAQVFGEFMKRQVSDLILRLHEYLETNSAQHPAVQSAIAPLAQAVQQFSAKDYAAAFASAFQAFRVLTLLRAGNPGLPEL